MMKDDTEKKILDAAVKVFSDKGYFGSTIKLISQESGFTEMTIFSKFQSKENLFKQVLIKNQAIILQEFNSIRLNHELTEKEAFIIIMNHLLKIIEKNFEYLSIILFERRRISDSGITALIDHIAVYLEKYYPSENVDYFVLSFNMVSFLYFLVFDKLMGNTIRDHEKA